VFQENTKIELGWFEIKLEQGPDSSFKMKMLLHMATLNAITFNEELKT
jgi:hypothetical protein